MNRNKRSANDNSQGLHLVSMTKRAHIMASLSLPLVAELWEKHAQICEESAALRGHPVPRKRGTKPVLELV